VERECEGLQHQVEVRSITQRIAGIQEQLEAASLLAEPRENAFLACDLATSLASLETELAALGRVRSSTTFPALCTVRLEQEPVVQLETTAVVRTVDYHGELG
jgi:tripartite motif-containing protein 2/3